METTLVTGATGLIGYNIVQRLLERGRKVKALVRSIEKGKKLLPESCEIVAGDITDKDSILNALQDCSVLYHAAGYPEQWKRNPDIFFRINVEGTQNIIEAALEKKIKRLIYTSTIDVFYGKAGEGYDESILDPRPKGTFYERSKQEADRRVAAALKRGLPVVFIHPAAVYGPGPAGSPGINDMIVRLHQRKIPALLPGGLPLVFAPDVGQGHVLAEEKAGIGSRYILSESYQDLLSLVRVALEELGPGQKMPPVLPLPIAKGVAIAGDWIAKLINKPPLIPRGQLHFLQWGARPRSDKARHELGWSPIPFREGIKKTIDFLI